MLNEKQHVYTVTL